MTALGGWKQDERESAAARARRRILRDLAGNVAAAVAALREAVSSASTTPRLAVV